MFFRQIIDAFLVRTEPDSSMVNPAHIHITSAPQTRKENVLKTNAVSSSTRRHAPRPAGLERPPGTRCRLPQG